MTTQSIAITGPVLTKKSCPYNTTSDKKTFLNTSIEIEKYDSFCCVTTERLTPCQAHKFYGERATCETWLDEAKNKMGVAHIKSGNFAASSLIFQCVVLAYNTIRWMALLSDNDQLKRWEIRTVRTYLIRTAGKLLTGSNQLRLKVPDQHLHENPWKAWLKLSFI
jgi:hypothetical protein